MVVQLKVGKQAQETVKYLLHSAQCASCARFTQTPLKVLKVMRVFS
jgi:NMD protein affecting ribosome stability and mRNA decay